MPSISIIIPVYNTERYLRECLDSIINQSFQDFEVICINDGSTDRSLDILNEYSKKDTRFIIINKKNEGQGVARNIGIEKANGKYLISVDSDDWLEKNALELAYNKINENHSDILFFDAYKFFTKTNQKYVYKYTETYKKFKEKCFSPEEAGEILFLTNGLTFKMYNLDFIKKNHIKFSDCKFIEDATFYIKSMLNAKKIICLSQPLYNYRILEKSSTTNYKEYFKCIPKVFNECFAIIEKQEVSNNILNSFLGNRERALLYFYSITPLVSKYKYYKMMQKIIKKYFKNYPLSSKLELISKTPFIIYQIDKYTEKTICILKTYFI